MVVALRCKRPDVGPLAPHGDSLLRASARRRYHKAAVESSLLCRLTQRHSAKQEGSSRAQVVRTAKYKPLKQNRQAEASLHGWEYAMRRRTRECEELRLRGRRGCKSTARGEEGDAASLGIVKVSPIIPGNSCQWYLTEHLLHRTEAVSHL